MQAKDYSDVVLDHYFQPRNVGELDVNDDNVVVGVAGSAASGEVIKLFLKIIDDVIVEAKFKAHGNCATIAAASWLTERILNKSLIEASEISAADIAVALSLPKVKQQASLLAEDALHNAIKSDAI